MPDFPVAEYEARLLRAQAMMHAQQIDALFLTTEADLRYFSGFRTAFWQSPTRPWFLIVPKDGEPVAVIPEIGAPLMRETWVTDIRTWSAPHPDDDGVALLANVLRGYASVGMPMGRASALRMPMLDFVRLRVGLEAVDFVDASPLLRALRMVKSEAEIEAIAAICTIGSRAFARAPALFCEGMALDSAFRAFRIALLEEGAEEVPYLVGAAGQGGYADVISPPTDAPLRAGDVLMLDTGASLRGYFCDFDRNFAIHHADEAAQSAYRTLWQATEAGLTAARPGRTCAQVFSAMAKVIGESSGGVGRLGHGLGTELTEEPSLIGFDHTILETGMVLTMEPSMAIGDGLMMVHEENFVVTENGPRLLTDRAAPELPVIA